MVGQEISVHTFLLKQQQTLTAVSQFKSKITSVLLSIKIPLFSLQSKKNQQKQFQFMKSTLQKLVITKLILLKLTLLLTHSQLNLQLALLMLLLKEKLKLTVQMVVFISNHGLMVHP